jgi:salicylate hydroxylase
MTSQILKIIIVGGGIAGLASAIALRAPEREIVVLEQSRLNKEIGALISLQPNASKIIEKWGLEERLKQGGSMTDKGFRIFSTDGSLKTQIPAASNNFGGERVIYHRRDLHDTLREVATSVSRNGPPASIKTTARVIECDCENGIIILESGEQVRGDVIIGADGMYSSQSCKVDI